MIFDFHQAAFLRIRQIGEYRLVFVVRMTLQPLIHHHSPSLWEGLLTDLCGQLAILEFL